MSLRRAARAALLPTVLAVAAGLLGPGPAAAEPLLSKGLFRPCATALPAGDDVRCLAVERATTTADGSVVPAAAAAPVPDGIKPAQLQAAYGVAGRSAPAGTTVGVVVAYDAPNVESDLATFRTTFGLPPCTTANGCFRKVDQRGVKVPAGKSTTSTTRPVYRDDGWQLETTLDTQAVSAMCPSCKILLVEADDAGLTTGLGPALARADALGATVISNSFAGGESADMTDAEARYWSKVDVPVFAASGDHGWNNLDVDASDPAYNHANYPATSPSVVTVGGTSADVSQGGVISNETVWSDLVRQPPTGTGSGCSFAFARPAFQTDYFAATGTRPDADTFCSTQSGSPARAAADMAALADPYAPGFPVYQQSAQQRWSVAGGTSLSVQLAAALAAYVGPRGDQSSIDQVAYAVAGAGAPTGLADVTVGSNKPSAFGCSNERICQAATGWDGPTGLGALRGPGLFAPLLTVSPTTTVVGATITVSGANLVPGEQVQFSVDGTRVGAATVDSDGTYQASVIVPDGVAASAPVTAVGLTSGLTATVSVVITPLSVTPATQTVAAGRTASVRLAGFGVREPVTATSDTGGTGQVVASGTTSGSGAATLTWTPSAGNTTQRVVVAGATTGRSAVVFVTVTSGAALPAAPTILSTVPTTAGGAVVGVRIATSGTRATSVAVIGSDGTLSPRASVSATGDAFVSVPTLATGATVTYTAVAGSAAGDSARSAPSLAVTGSTAVGTGDLTPVGPVRRLDTRLSGGPLGQGATRRVQIAGTAGVPSTGVSAVVVSLTVLTPSTRTYFTLWPSGESRPTVSNANTPGAGGYKASLAKVKLGADGAIDVYNYAGSAGFILDVVGFYAAGSSSGATFGHNQSYAATTPVRVADTRSVPNAPTRSGGSIVVPIRGTATGVPADANSVELIVQAVNATASGYVTVYPTGRAGGVPLVSNVQAAPGKPVATAVVATIGSNGTVTVFAQARTDVIVDVVGYYAGSANGRFTPISPRRYLDTRLGGDTPLGSGATRTLPIAGAAARDGSRQVPGTATSVSFSLTAVDNTVPTYITAWRAGTAKPLVTTLLPNPARGVFDNLGLAGVGNGGAVAFFNYGGRVDVVVDVQGYYSNGPN